jgi:hypothetical protein
LSRYDAHLLIEELASSSMGDDDDDEMINIVPTTAETYIAFSKKVNKVTFQFLDSYRFMPASLEKLVCNLKDEQMVHTSAIFPKSNEFALIRQKGIFPYKYITSESILNETKLPSKNNFYSELSDTHISEADYNRAKLVWTTFKCKTIGDYSDLYLMTDVYLLTDVFENFRKLIFKTYGLEAAAYLTAPGLAFSAALIISKVELQLLQDIDMVTFFERSLRGGICQVSCKHATSNSFHSPHTYNPNKNTEEILYIDANGLYSFAMTSKLPTGDFKWIDDLETLKNDIIDGSVINRFGNNQAKSCMIECDIDYPNEIHDEHSSYPFCSEHKITQSKTKKLLLTLHDKKNYIIHIENLLQCLKHGLILKKIHSAIEFTHSEWLKPFIDLNAKLRAEATNDFDKQQYKDLSNMTYGKLMENVRKYRQIYLVNSWEKAKSLVAKPNFLRFKIFNENLVAVEMKKTHVVYNKPFHIGSVILDLSKTVMYSFVYDYLNTYVKPNFKYDILYTDTDSFIIKFINQNNSSYKSIYEIIKRDAHLMFDTSNYKENNTFNIPLVNHKIIGKFKDELGGILIDEFIGLRAKVYVIRTGKDVPFKKHKGIGHSSVKKLTFDDFREALFSDNKVTKICSFHTILSKNHKLFTCQINKVALVNYDDKRKCLDGINSLPWGHYRISAVDDDDDNN